LQKDKTGEDSFIDRYRHSFYKGRSADIFFRIKPYYLISSGLGTSHGSPYDYDSHVPLIFMGPGIQPGFRDQKVRTVDLAATLTEILGIKPANEIDGQSLASIISKK
jgi:predicted AlkP superfamily pyrophosphatase or phosphodiesterase